MYLSIDPSHLWSESHRDGGDLLRRIVPDRVCEPAESLVGGQGGVNRGGAQRGLSVVPTQPGHRKVVGFQEAVETEIGSVIAYSKHLTYLGGIAQSGECRGFV